MNTKILSPLRRDGYKAGMIMMLIALSTMLLTTACSNEDDALNNTANTENTINKGYALPVTVNVTRQGDAATRATFDGSKLNFSAGDKLFVNGDYDSGSKFAGTLTWQSGGTFSGTIYTSSGYSGTADALFSSAMGIYATLLPAGYDSYNFLSIDDHSSSEKYDDEISISRANAFVASATAKKTGVEQLSWEQAFSYSSVTGFALAPRYAVLNFTITGLTAGAKDVTLQVTDGTLCTVTGSVTPNASGVATFAVGVPDDTNIQNVANNLTVGSSNFTLPSDIDFAAGKIYNITRSTLTYPIALSAVTSSYVCSIVTTDGNVYATVAAARAASKTAAAMIAYVSDTGHGLALALEDEGWMDWSTAKTTCEAHTPAVTGGTWQLPSQEEWNNMITAAGSYTALRDGFSSFGGTNMNAGTYWSSTDAGTMYSIQLKYGYKFHESEGSWGSFGSTSSQNTRACLAF